MKPLTVFRICDFPTGFSQKLMTRSIFCQFVPENSPNMMTGRGSAPAGNAAALVGIAEALEGNAAALVGIAEALAGNAEALVRAGMATARPLLATD